MPRRKDPKSETIDEVVEEISTAENCFNEEINNIFGDDNSNEKSEKVKPKKVAFVPAVFCAFAMFSPLQDHMGIDQKRLERP